MLEKLRQQKTSTQWAGKLYKGTRKLAKKTKDGRDYEGYGSDLNDYFRFEPYSNAARIALSKIEGAKKDDNGDVLIPYLDIFLAYETIATTFKVNMKVWDSTGLAQTCDGTTITTIREEYKDSLGTRTKMVECKKPCAIADSPLGSLCPNNCKQEGELMFYSPQLINAGVELPVLLTVHAWSDLFSVLECLETIEEQYGSIKSSPFPCGSFGNLIPLILRRNKTKIRRPVVSNQQRTGKKTSDETWATTLSVNPMWRQAYLAWQQAMNVRSLGYQPSANLLQLTGVVYVEDAASAAAVPTDILIGGTSSASVSSLMLPNEADDRINIPASIDDSDKPMNWRPKAIEWAILEGLKRETVEAIASRSTTYDEFVGMATRASAIAWAIDKGIEEATAKAMLKGATSVFAFKQEVQDLLNTVEVEAADAVSALDF